jgi:hypothetical protein
MSEGMERFRRTVTGKPRPAGGPAKKGAGMVRKLLLAAVLLAALPLAGGSATAAKCPEWNAWSPAQHHKAGPVDVVGGHGYGSGFHSDTYESPPQGPGRYGDPQRQAGQGGYVSVKQGGVYAQVHLFGPLDENDTGHIYDTELGGCVGSGSTSVSAERCIGTSKKKGPKTSPKWKPCDGYN